MKTQCPHCNQFYDIENHLCDSIVKCENCGQEFVVEPLKEEPPPQLRKVPVATATQAKPTAKPKTKKKMIFVAVALVVLALLGTAYFHGSRRLAYKQAQAACEQAKLELEDIKRQNEIERQKDLEKDQIVLYIIKYLVNHTKLSHTQVWEVKNTLDDAGIDWRGLGLRVNAYSDNIASFNLIEFETAFRKQQQSAERARLVQEYNAFNKVSYALENKINALIKLNISKEEKEKLQKELQILLEARKNFQTTE